MQTLSAQIPWSHNIVILDKVKDPEKRIWYIKKTAENGWSHSVLIHQIENGLYQRQVLAEKVSNAEARMLAPHSELTVQTMLSTYSATSVIIVELFLHRISWRPLLLDTPAFVQCLALFQMLPMPDPFDLSSCKRVPDCSRHLDS